MEIVILKSIRPQHVKNILNGDKLLEMDKSAPKEWKDYLSGKTKEKPKPRRVLIYCTKGPGFCYHGFEYKAKIVDNVKVCEGDLCNGKVIAKFTLKEVFEVFHSGIVPNYVLEESCLTYEELQAYFKGKTGYAWRIDDLVIFDKPLVLGDFYDGWQFMKSGFDKYYNQDHSKESYCSWADRCEEFKVRKAPQSWQFIEYSEPEPEEE